MTLKNADQREEMDLRPLCNFMHNKKPQIPTLPQPPPRWNTKRADWVNFTKILEEQLEFGSSTDLEEHNHLLTTSFKTVAEATIPRTTPP